VITNHEHIFFFTVWSQGWRRLVSPKKKNKKKRVWEQRSICWDAIL